MAPEVDPVELQKYLDSLRTIRKQLYSIADEVPAMGLADQVLYGKCVHKVGLAILKLETAKLKGVNDQFKAREPELKAAIKTLGESLVGLQDAVQVVRVIAEAIGVIIEIIKLLPF